MPQYCAAVNCNNLSSKLKNVSFFRFPKDTEMFVNVYICIIDNSKSLLLSVKFVIHFNFIFQSTVNVDIRKAI